jgi:ATP-binding cassette subfamily B protein
MVDDLPGAVEMPAIEGSLEFRDVNFSYEEGDRILNDVSFKVNTGDTIALVGPTGAGKTTVVNLISRFYNLDSGEIFIDGTDIKGVTLNSLRKQMGITLQDSFIFSGTIKEISCL